MKWPKISPASMFIELNFIMFLKITKEKKCPKKIYRYCDKSFKRPRNLIDHEASVHTLQDLYTCSFCPRTFRNQSNMLSHRKKQHPDQYQKPSYMRDDVVV